MRINKWICCFLTALLVLSCIAAAFAAEEEGLVLAVGGDEETHITVANATKVNGAFYTRQFGNNTSDIDVREMIQGYNPIVWDTQLTYITDPQVVESMRSYQSGGNTVYAFKLCKDLTWNDGTPITASDFVFSYLLQASKQFEEIGGDTDIFRYIVGYEEYASGETDVFKGIRLTDTYSYSVTVKKEYLPYFYEYTYLYITPSPISVIAPGCAVEDTSKGAHIVNSDKAVKNSVYTSRLLKKTILDEKTGYLSHPQLTCGPYNMDSYDAATGTVEFSINPYYKGNYLGVKPVINTITLVHAFPQDMPEMLRNGEIDVINKAVDGNVINELISVSREGGFTYENYPRLGYGFIGVSTEQGPQQFVKVRQAIAYAFDTDDFITKFLQGYGLADYGYYGLGQWMTMAALGTLRLEEMTASEALRWDAVNLDNLNHYDYDPEMSLSLLIEDGWTLNAKGGEFDPEVDKVRYKQTDEGLMALSFDFGLIADNPAASDVLNRLREVLEPIGVEFIIHEEPFTVILEDYLREDGGKREYDMSFLAYNFNAIFDPLVEIYSNDGTSYGTQNAMAIIDDELMQLCWDLHYTEPGDLITFLERWVKFQERYNEILPSIPLYTNVYFDFLIDTLQNYHPGAEAHWPGAMIYAFIGEPITEEETGDEFGDEFEDEFEDEEEIFID